MNRDLGMEQTFTPLSSRGYALQSRSSNSCLGQSGSGLVSAIPDNQAEYPSYFYNFVEGSISCNYSITDDNLFPECTKDLLTSNKKPWESVSCSKNEFVLARYTIEYRNGSQGYGGYVPGNNGEFMSGGGGFYHHYKTPNMDKNHRSYNVKKDGMTWMLGVFEKEKYKNMDKKLQPDQKIFRTKEELIDYTSKWFKPPSPPDENMPPMMRREYEDEPKTAEEYVNRNIPVFDRGLRDLSRKPLGEGKFFCD